MHIFFSGIGGTAIGPLAQIAQQAGYEVSGSDKQASQYIDYLKKHGIENNLALLAMAIALLLMGPGRIAVGDWEPRLFRRRG